MSKMTHVQNDPCPVLEELDMLFAITYDGSEVISNVSRQYPFQFIKHTVVIKYNIPSALVESQQPVQ